METIYQTISGQDVRQHQSSKYTLNKPIIVQKIDDSNYPELTKCSGQDSFTQKMWSTDLDTIERWLKDWSYYPEKIKIKVI